MEGREQERIDHDFRVSLYFLVVTVILTVTAAIFHSKHEQAQDEKSSAILFGETL
jgi:hypothetical protein